MAEAAGSRVLLLGVCVAGIWAAYVYQGVLQENLSTKKFGDDGVRFKHLTFLNWAQNVVCFVWSLLMLVLWSPKSTSQAPLWAFWSASITNSIGPACGILALRYISYPAQVLAKSSKMIPAFYAYSQLVLNRGRGLRQENLASNFFSWMTVMLMGAIVYGVRYTLPEYVCTLLVAGGVATFALFKRSSKKVLSTAASPNAPYGYGLCFLNLGFDGFTNSTQDSIKSSYPKTTGWQLMLGMNFWGSIYMTVFMFGWSGGGGYEAVKFCKEHPEAAWDILMFCLCGAIGQNFIFLTISRFGALTNTTITTTRKFVSILVSALWNGNPLTFEQWGGVIMVFTGLSYQIFLKWQKGRGRSKLKPKPHTEEKSL